MEEFNVFVKEVEQLKLQGRDSFRTFLINSQVPVWMYVAYAGSRISDDMVNFLCKKYDFTKEERESLHILQSYINLNAERIRAAIKDKGFNEHIDDYAILEMLARRTKYDDVGYDPAQGCVISRRDGTMFVSLHDAVLFAIDYHARKLASELTPRLGIRKPELTFLNITFTPKKSIGKITNVITVGPTGITGTLE